MEEFKAIKTPKEQKSSTREGGYALLYVIAVMIFVGFTSSWLIGLTRRDAVSAQSFASLNNATISARSALAACENYFKTQPVAAIALLNNYLRGASPGWIFGTTDDPFVLKGEQKFTARIVQFDRVKFAIQIEIIGYGKDRSKKRAIAIYRLQGIKVVPPPGEFALYIQGEMTFNAEMHITGKVYANEDFDCSSGWTTGSVFNGPVIVRRDAYFAGQVTFNDVFFCGRNVDITEFGPEANQIIAFNNRSGINGNFTQANPADEEIRMSQETFFNRQPASNLTGIGNPFFHFNGAAFTPGAGIVGFQLDNNGNRAINIPAAMNLRVFFAQPLFDESVIPAAKIMKWSQLKNKYIASAVPGLANHVVPAVVCGDGQQINAYTGNLGNAICSYAASNGYSWNGFALVDIDDALYPYTGDGDFTGRIIFINNANMQVGATIYSGWPNCGLNSITVIINKNVMQVGQSINFPDNVFRGYIYNDPASDLFDVKPANCAFFNIRGAVHNLRPAGVRIDDWHPDDNHNRTNLIYDEAVMQAISDIGLVENVNPNDPVIDDQLVLIDTISGITALPAGVSY
ncbi:MAG: hypothetical protein JW795_08205 [Chitinivibrionales bacterium]|nr:hypothetical protein [Chitinivibrionales bacterium]